MVEELLKTREKIQESFTSVPSAPKEVSSSNMAKGSGEDSSLLSADDSQSPTSELNAENAKKSNKWFNLNFKTKRLTRSQSGIDDTAGVSTSTAAASGRSLGRRFSREQSER
nr:uncharacterized protein LOC112280980 [Physcomitrium patens]|eukprot:XP_024372768.1 uncharacterized protein LOC112280980 [Physcomitrella patens]